MKRIGLIFNILFTLLLLITLPITAYLVTQRQDLRNQAANEAEIQLIPNHETAKSGEKILLAVDVKTQTAAISSVQLNVSYPTNKLTLSSIDTSHTKFDLEEEKIIGNGYAQIARTKTTPEAGSQHFATLEFSTKEDASVKEIAVLPNSTIIGSDNRSYTPSVKVISDKSQTTDSFLEPFKNFGRFLFTLITNPLSLLP